MEKKCREFYAHSSPQDSIYVAGPKNTERFNYPVEIDPGYEPQRSAEDEFLSLILWRLVELSLVDEPDQLDLKRGKEFTWNSTK